MPNTKRLRLAFYLLAILDVTLVAAWYAVNGVFLH